jgi:hypothetical protein
MSNELVKNLHVEDAACKLSKEEYGIHYIIVYPDLTTLRGFYSHYARQQLIEKQNSETTLIALFYETTDSVRQTLSGGHAPMDVAKHEEKDKTLLLVDAYHHYFDGEGEEGENNLSIAEERMVKHAIKRGKSGFSILIDTAPYPYKDNRKELVDYEISMPKKFGLEIKRVCLYHQKDFDMFQQEQKQRLIEHHGMAIEIHA